MQMYQTIMDKLAKHESSIDELMSHYQKGSNKMHEYPEISNVYKPQGGYGSMGGLFGGDGGVLGGLLIGALLSNRNGGGLFGGDGGGGAGLVVNEITNTQVLSKLGDIQGSIPLTAAQTQNAILQQSNTICQGLNQLGNTVMNGSTNNLLATKDLSTQVAQGNALILQAIAQSELQSLRDRLIGVEANHRALGTEVNVTQTVNQAQAQQQQQAQLAGIHSMLMGLPAFIQRGQNELINIGSGTVSGNTAANTNTAIR